MAQADVELADQVRGRDARVWGAIRERAAKVELFGDALRLITLRKRARALAVPEEPAMPPLRVAMVGGATLQPLRDLVELFLWTNGFGAELFTGDYDNYFAEILEPGSPLHAFAPQVTVILPSAERCRYDGPTDAPLEEQRRRVDTAVDELLALCRAAHEPGRCDVVITNFALPALHDIGALRARSLTNDWTFKKAVNLELGLRAPPFVVIGDIEFLSARHGGLLAREAKVWFESKQPFAFDFAVAAAREIAHVIASTRRAPKKLLVLDLDNTLWGGVVGDDGVEGIELGDTSPRGEAFKAFQRYVRSLKDRGVLLAVASKNDYERAIEPFQRHPESVLKLNDFVAFKANWNPKSDNIREMATELTLGVDSFVFVDDNPAEIEIVRQFVPEVATILLGPDPSEYVAQLADSRYFEPRAITTEDRVRSVQYQQEAERQAHRATVTDMASYLSSLEMHARIIPFRPEDIPRVAQLIGRSNQWNLTTRRRSESEVSELMASTRHACFSVRLADRFGDHGLIAVVVCAVTGDLLDIDTWLMSCRVLKRQVEEVTLNEIVRLAERHGTSRIRGTYLPTAKNGMVRELYPRLGFRQVGETEAGGATFESNVDQFVPLKTKIAVAYE